MPGNMTHGYDMVIEFAEQAIQKVVSAVLDGSSLFTGLGAVLDAIPGVQISSDGFRSSINFDRPSGVAIPPGGKPIDIRLDWLNSAGTVEAELRIVAGMVVDRSAPGTDVLKLDMRDALFFLELRVGTNPVANALLGPVRNWLRDHLPLIPLLPVPVDRATTDSKHIRQADAILADAATDARDAIGVGLTFGGGSPGDSNAFTSGLVDWGDGEAPGAIAVFLGWVLRMLDPALDSAFDQPAGTFRNGQLTRSFDVGDDTTLTAFSITLQDGFLAVSATVEKSGFCWSARGTIGARIRIAIVEGRLQVSTQVDDPDVELDIPWYCYLAAAIVGALGGLLIGGVIGAAVGGVLVPLLLFALEEGLEGTLDGIADHIRDTLNELAPSVDIPAAGINIVFQSVEIDDITIRCSTSVADLAPVRGAGVVTLRAGQGVDLETGRVGAAEMEGADLRLDGAGDGRSLRTVCAAMLARTGRTDFDRIPRWACYPMAFAPSVRVASGEMWHSIHLPFIADISIPTGAVFAVRTGQGRNALVQVVDVREDRIQLRWKAWERRVVSARIEGAFRCVDAVFSEEAAVFQPGIPFAKFEPTQALRLAVADLEAAKAPRLAGRLGEWTRRIQARRIEGRFLSAIDGFASGAVHRWTIDGKPLVGSGSFVQQGVEFRYLQNGAQLQLTAPVTGREVAMELRVDVSDAQSNQAVASRCVRSPRSCAKLVRDLPKWAVYRPIYLEKVGIRIVKQDLQKVLADLPRLERVG